MLFIQNEESDYKEVVVENRSTAVPLTLAGAGFFTRFYEEPLYTSERWTLFVDRLRQWRDRGISIRC